MIMVYYKVVSYADELFDELIEELVRETLKAYPLMGTFLGLHQYDVLVPELSRESVLRWLSFN